MAKDAYNKICAGITACDPCVEASRTISHLKWVEIETEEQRADRNIFAWCVAIVGICIYFYFVPQNF